MKTSQYPHQVAEYEAHRADEARALLWQMRTGKSKATIDKACWLAEGMEIDRVLVIAPNGGHRNWVERELPLHHWESGRLTRLAFAWCNSSRYNDANFTRFLGMPRTRDGISRLRWLAMNMESLIVPRAKKAIAKFMSGGPSMAVFDESHHFARPGARRTAAARGTARLAQYRTILSGTPVENTPLQAFSQYELLAKGALGCGTYEEFKQHYADWSMEGWGPRRYEVLKGYKNLEELKARMAPYTSVVLRSECEGLPAVDAWRAPVELTEDQLTWHGLQKDNDAAFLRERGRDDDPVAGAALLTKLQQIEGGFYKRADGKQADWVMSLESNPKMLALADVTEAYDGQVIVWCMFLHELEAVSEFLGKRGRTTAKLYGATKDRQALLKKFARGGFDTLVAQPAAAAECYDMSTAGMVVWYSQTPDAIMRAQGNERATAIGGKTTMLVDLVVAGGVDEYYLGITDEKTTVADDVSRRGMKKVLEQIDPRA